MTVASKSSTSLHSNILEVFVAPGCWGCETATSLADSIRDRRLPGLRIDVIDLSRPESDKPSNVFAVPTYLLDGKVISLGNPDESEIVDQLRMHLTDRNQSETRETSENG